MKQNYFFILLLLFYISLTNAVAQNEFIVVNQFGYLPEAQKIAIIRSPRRGPDAAQGEIFRGPVSPVRVYDAATDQAVFSGSPVLIEGKNGTMPYPDYIDQFSGDVVWHFDFSSLSAPGRYYIKDASGQSSYQFNIAEDVYVNLFKIVFRNFYFQRFKTVKEMPYCLSEDWADAACYTQEERAANYMDRSDDSQWRDVSGGWFDAGDLNKYVNFLDPVFRNLLLSYVENPEAFGDDMGIPESGNGIPDILDEIKWGLDWLLKMQKDDGSVLSVVGGSNGATPPSADKKLRYFGPANTSSTLNFALYCAYAAQIFAKEPQQALKDYAVRLQECAEKAWAWADANPNVIFYNNDNSKQPGSSGLCAGQNETDSNGRKSIKLRAAVYLYGLTRADKYGYYIQSNYSLFAMVSWYGTLNEYFLMDHEACFYLINLPNPPAYLNTAINTINDRMKSRMQNSTFEYSLKQLVENKRDAYMSFIDEYNWGTNGYKAGIGNTLRQVAKTNWVNATEAQTYNDLSAYYLHFICGLNPLNYVYLSNMTNYGASKSITKIFHRWFFVGTQFESNPAPGYLPGGPNYRAENADGSKIFASDIPYSKCYIDFNADWSMTEKPNCSWQITENSIGWQAPLVRLLANFVPRKSASSVPEIKTGQAELKVYPIPAQEIIQVTLPEKMKTAEIQITDMTGSRILTANQTVATESYSLAGYSQGIYLLSATDGINHLHSKILKK